MAQHFNPYDLLDEDAEGRPVPRPAAAGAQQQQQAKPARQAPGAAQQQRAGGSGGGGGGSAGCVLSGAISPQRARANHSGEIEVFGNEVDGGPLMQQLPTQHFTRHNTNANNDDDSGSSNSGGGGGAAAAGAAAGAAPAAAPAASAARPFDYYRAFQRVLVDRATGDVVLRFHRTDVVAVRPSGDVALHTGGHYTAATLACMNDALRAMGMALRANPGTPVQAGSWTLHDGHAPAAYRDGMVAPARAPADAGRGRAVFDAYTGGGVPFPGRSGGAAGAAAGVGGGGDSTAAAAAAAAARPRQPVPGVRPPPGFGAAAAGAAAPSAAAAAPRLPVSEQLAAAAAAHSLGSDDDLDDDEACVVCFAAARAVALVPCGHHVLCAACADDVMASGAECPMCRVRIEECIAME